MKNLIPIELPFECKECKYSRNLDDKIFKEYFSCEKNICPKCNSELNLWDFCKMQIEFPFFGWYFNLLGCVVNIKQITLKPNEIYDLELSDEIGEGELLFRNYTSRGKENVLLPIQFHGNDPLKDYLNSNIKLIPHSFSDSPIETKVIVNYAYAPKEIVEDLSTMLMLDAFKSFYNKNYRYMFISAQTSIEILQYNFFEGLFHKHKLPKKKTTDFLETKATFSTQLFTLLPLFANVMLLPPINQKMIEGLTILRDIRNDLIHSGRTKEVKWTKENFIKSLLSAFLIFKYFKLFKIE